MNGYKDGFRAAMQVGEKALEMGKAVVRNLQQKSKQRLVQLGEYLKAVQSDIEALTARIAEIGIPKDQAQLECLAGYLLLGLFGVIVVAEFCFVGWTFDPFEELKLKGYVFSTGITLTMCVFVHLSLGFLKKIVPEEKYNRVLFFMTVVTILTMLVAAMGLAAVRGWIAQTLLEGGTGGLDPRIFYARAGRILFLAFMTFTAVFSFGGGIILKLALDKLSVYRRVLRLYRKLSQKRETEADLKAEMEEVKNAPEQYQNDYERGAVTALEKVRRTLDNKEGYELRKLWIYLVVILLAILLAFGVALKAFGDELRVVGLDLSRSTEIKGPDGLSEFQKNVEGVEQEIERLQPKTRFMVAGITSNSFDAYILLDEKTGDRAGYFKEIITADRQRITLRWREVSVGLRATYQTTDVIGFFFLVQEIVEACGPCDEVNVVVFSDLRHCANGIDIEKPDTVPLDLVKKLSERSAIANLKNVVVFAYAVHCHRKSRAYWESLRRWWTEYLRLAGAELRVFTPLRMVSHE